jgi:hypothetical protein
LNPLKFAVSYFEADILCNSYGSIRDKTLDEVLLLDVSPYAIWRLDNESDFSQVLLKGITIPTKRSFQVRLFISSIFIMIPIEQLVLKF